MCNAQTTAANFRRLLQVFKIKNEGDGMLTSDSSVGLVEGAQVTAYCYYTESVSPTQARVTVSSDVCSALASLPLACGVSTMLGVH